MIVANLATYPPRKEGVLDVVSVIAPQVDVLNVVLNEYDAPLDALDAYPNVAQHIPDADTKDTGKFLPDVDPEAVVFLIDDDLVYPADYVAAGMDGMAALGGGRVIYGFHGSTYHIPKFSLNTRELKRWWTYDPAKIAEYRQVISFYRGRRDPFRVDQIGTGTAIMRGDLLPPFDYMATSQSFVDVRLAKWAFEQGIAQVVLPKADHWIQERSYESTIYNEFTRRNPSHVADEIRSYAYKQPESGRVYRPVPPI